MDLSQSASGPEEEIDIWELSSVAINKLDPYR